MYRIPGPGSGRRIGPVGVAFAAAAISTVAAAGGQGYIVKEIRDLPGLMSEAWDINAFGHVVGQPDMP